MTSHNVRIYREAESGNEEILSYFDTLINTLDEEIVLFKELSESLRSEHELLVKLSMDELKENNEARDRLLAKEGLLDDVRTEMVSKISSYYNLDVSNMSLSQLIPYADNKQRDRLTQCRSVLRSLLREIVESNNKNMTIINSSVQYTRKSLEFIRDMMAPAPTYGETGLLKKDNVNGNILSRVG